MPIVLSRIDDRLIHGQVVEGWMKAIPVSSVIVVSDKLSRDRMGQAMMSMAVPDSVKVESLSIDDTVARYTGGGFSAERMMLLFSNPGDVRRLLEKGVLLDSVNVGGMHFSQGKYKVTSSINVNDEDIRDILAIAGKGVELETRVFPGDDKMNIVPLLTKLINSAILFV